jgi:hypothetical protein
MDYITFCQRFFAATGVPVTLLEQGTPVYSSLNPTSVSTDSRWNMWRNSRNPEFLAQTENLEYGRVWIEGTEYDVILGPLFTTPVTPDIVEEFLSDQQTPKESRELSEEILFNLPVISHPQCLRYLIFLHLCLNHKLVEAEDFYAESEQTAAARSREQIAAAVDAKENESFHNSYAFELQLYHYIAMGDPNKLRTFLESIREFPRRDAWQKPLCGTQKTYSSASRPKRSPLVLFREGWTRIKLISCWNYTQWNVNKCSQLRKYTACNSSC